MSSVNYICQSQYHIVFVPKYRYKMFRSEHVKNFCKNLFFKIAEEYNYIIHELKILDDHIHLFISIPKTKSLTETFRIFKSIIARELFQTFQGFQKRLPKRHFWSGCNFYRSVGAVTSETVEKYIRESQGDFIKETSKQQTISSYL